MRLAIDTNRYCDMMRGVPAVAAAVEEAESIVMPFVTIAELRCGFAMGSRGRENERLLRRFLQRSDVATVYPDDTTTVQYVSIYQQLRRQGTPIPTNDMWIAALVLQHGLVLFARDQHFDHLSQLPRL